MMEIDTSIEKIDTSVEVNKPEESAPNTLVYKPEVSTKVEESAAKVELEESSTAKNSEQTSRRNSAKSN